MSADPILLHAANPSPMTGRGNNTWLLDGDVPTLVDAGVGEPAHVDAIERALDGRLLAQVLVTHGHADHSSGAPALRSRWPMVEILKWPLPGEQGIRKLFDGQAIDAGDTELIVVHTPGHAPDHVCFWQADTRAVFAGDMVVAGATVMIPAGHGGNLRDYLASLERMRALGAARIYPGHGPIIDRPSEIIEEYVRHRAMRERQVVACLDSGIEDVEAMVTRIYPELADALKPAARLTIEAHLEKLREDGRLR